MELYDTQSNNARNSLKHLVPSPQIQTWESKPTESHASADIYAGGLISKLIYVFAQQYDIISSKI